MYSFINNTDNLIIKIFTNGIEVEIEIYNKDDELIKAFTTRRKGK